MAEFKVDTDIISTTITTYQTSIDDIEKAIQDAQQAIDTLKTSGWKSNASRAFFDNFDLSWKTSVNDRVKVMKHLRDCLQNALTDYESLYAEAAQIGNAL